ncbi:MAG: hypothetical protein V1916_02765, partial [Patescibacteria group bacterium]
MNAATVHKFFLFLKKTHTIFAPTRDGGDLYVKPVEQFLDIDFTNRIPINTFKPVLLPKRETLFDFQRGKLREPVAEYHPECGFLMSVVDLKAVGLFHQVFERDPYYQRKRQSTLLVGHAWFEGSGFTGHVRDSYEEEFLEHVIFDIML